MKTGASEELNTVTVLSVHTNLTPEIIVWFLDNQKSYFFLSFVTFSDMSSGIFNSNISVYVRE